MVAKGWRKHTEPPAGKDCPLCGEWKSREHFHVGRKNSNGMGTYCKPCKAIKAKEEREKNSERYRTYQAARRAAGLVNDPEYHRAYYQKNRERLDKQNAEWNAKNREKRTAISLEYQARRKQWLAAGDATPAELRDLFSRYNGKCHYCGAEIHRPAFGKINAKGFDHVVPLAKGGQHTISNIVPCCKPCNVKKGLKERPDND